MVARSGNTKLAGHRRVFTSLQRRSCRRAIKRLKPHGKLSPILTDEQRAKLAEIEARLDDIVSDAIGRLGERLAE